MAPDAQGFVRGAEENAEPILYAVRHGETKMNAGQKFRGNDDTPLDAEGKQQADDAAEELKGVEFTAAYSSDIPRASETLHRIVGEHSNVVPQQLVALRPWHVGDFTGQPKTAANKKKLQTYADEPDKPIPNGESLSQFRDRYQHCFYGLLRQAKANGPILVVQHATTNHELGNMFFDDIDALDVEPGGIIGVYFTPNGLKAERLKGHAKADTQARYTS